MKMTSALANKLIKEYNDEITHLMQVEADSMAYTEVVGQEAVVPEYSFMEMGTKISDLNNKVLVLKHAVNRFNTETMLPELGITIDEALVRMAQLNKLKQRYQQMRNMPEKKLARGYMASSNATEYVCRNFKIEQVEAAYNRVSNEIKDIQLKLDLLNNTVPFEVDIEV